MKTIKLTKPYIIEGEIIDEGTELVISSDGVDETINDTANEPVENEIDLGIVAKEDTSDVKEDILTEEETKEEDKTDEEEKKSE